MSKITDSAYGEQCSIRLPSVCNFDPATTVFAHIAGIRFGHGWGVKTKLGAYACSSCHDIIDGRAMRPDDMSQDYVKLAHAEGVLETLLKLEKKGLVKL